MAICIKHCENRFVHILNIRYLFSILIESGKISWIEILFVALVIIFIQQHAEAHDDNQEGNVCSASDLTCSAASECLDKESVCVEYAEKGRCQSNPLWMLTNCPLSCRHCPKDYG